MKIVIAHQTVPSDATSDERDVLVQAAAVSDALVCRGHAVSVLPCTTDLGNMLLKLDVLKPYCVFNLVETLENSGRLIHLAQAIWEKAGIPFTGCSSEALPDHTQTACKERMLMAGLPVPEWVGGGERNFKAQRSTSNAHPDSRLVVKSVLGAWPSIAWAMPAYCAESHPPRRRRSYS